jgi:hypothetical protein
MPATNETLTTTYPELLDAGSDPALRQLVGDLHLAYTAVDPPPTLERAVRLAMSEAAPPPPLRQPGVARAGQGAWWRRSHLAASAAVLLVAALLVGGGYAVRAATLDPGDAIIQRTVAMDLGVAQVARAGLLHDERIGRSRDGFTVSLRRAYADANRIVLVTTVTAPPTGRSTQIVSLRGVLTDGQGDVLPPLTGDGSGMDGGTEAFMNSYDAAPIAGHPATVALHLQIDALQVETPADVPAPVPQRPWDRLRGLDRALQHLRPATTTIGYAQRDSAPVRTIPGPFTFDVTVPLLPARSATPNQTATAQGVSIALQQVVVTPSMVRADLQIPASHGLPARDWFPAVRVVTGSWDSRQPRAQGGGALAPNGIYYYHFFAAPPHPAGPWTLTIETMEGANPQHLPVQLHLTGPWVFRFTLP